LSAMRDKLIVRLTVFPLSIGMSAFFAFGFFLKGGWRMKSLAR
jgi:hypothetical protein